MNKWETLETKIEYENPYFKVIKKAVKSPTGKLGDFYIVDRDNFGVTVPVIGDSFLMVRQFRQSLERESLEFPMGGSNPGESLKQCAERELLEETGHIVKKLTLLGKAAVAPGHSKQSFEVYLAEDLMDEKAQNLDDFEEGIENELIKIADFPELVRTGKIVDVPTLAAYALYQMHKLKF